MPSSLEPTSTIRPATLWHGSLATRSTSKDESAERFAMTLPAQRDHRRPKPLDLLAICSVKDQAIMTTYGCDVPLETQEGPQATQALRRHGSHGFSRLF